MNVKFGGSFRFYVVSALFLIELIRKLSDYLEAVTFCREQSAGTATLHKETTKKE
jgi:hypothetical protein